MDEKQFSQTLNEIANERIRDDMDLWQNIQREIRPRRHTFFPITRLGAVASLAIVLMMSVGAYALGQLMLSNSDTGLDAITQEGKMVSLQLSQTKDPVTVTLDYAYADSNRVAVAYKFQYMPEPEKHYTLGDIVLTDENNQVLDLMFGGGGGSGGGGGGGTVDPALIELNGILNFDPTRLTITGNTIALRLTLEVRTEMLPNFDLGGSGGGSLEITSTSGEGGGAVVGTTSAESSEMAFPIGELFGTFEFEFTIPFTEGMRYQTPQTVVASEVEMTLNTVVVTPSLTRLELCFTTPEVGYWTPFAVIDVDGKRVVEETALMPFIPPTSDSPTRCTLYNLPLPLDEYIGNWTLTITRLTLSGSANPVEVAEALKLQGIEAKVTDGILSMETPDGMPYETFSQIVSQAFADLETKYQGEWVFTFPLSNATD